CFSDEGDRFVVEGPSGWEVRSSADGSLLDTVPDTTLSIDSVAASRDGTEAVISARGSLRWMRLDDGSTRIVADAASGELFASPTADGLAVASPRGGPVVLLDARTGEVRGRLSLARAQADGQEGSWSLYDPCGVAFSPDGARLVTFGYRHPVQMWNARDGALLRVLGDGKLPCHEA